MLHAASSFPTLSSSGNFEYSTVLGDEIELSSDSEFQFLIQKMNQKIKNMVKSSDSRPAKLFQIRSGAREREKDIDRKTEIERQRQRDRETERQRKGKEKEEKRERKNSARDGEKKQIEKERERDRETRIQKKFGACSTSLSGGNQVDGLPPVVHLMEK